MSQKILVVDDHADTRAICRELFTHFGYEVFEAVDGVQALDVALSNVPDIILLDFLMPGADGEEVLAELRANEALRGAKVILFTAAATELARLTTLEGISAVLLKPIETRRLLHAVQAILGTPENSSLGPAASS